MLNGVLIMILQAWNTLNNSELSLSGPVGQVYAMVVGNDLLFAGTQVIFWTMSTFLLSMMFFLMFSKSCFITTFSGGLVDV